MKNLKLPDAMKKNNVYSAVFIFCVLIYSGCATLEEAAKGIAGISTRELEKNRINAVKKVFAYGYDDCHSKVSEILKDIKAYVYAEDKKNNLIAVYISESDTTPVGVYLKKIDEFNTQVEISSPSTFGKEFISNGVFSGLEKQVSKK